MLTKTGLIFNEQLIFRELIGLEESQILLQKPVIRALHSILWSINTKFGMVVADNMGV